MEINDEYTKEVTTAVVSNSIVMDADGTMFVKVAGNQDGPSIKKLDDDAIAIIKTLNYKPNIIFDVSNAGLPDPAGRKLIIESLGRDDFNMQVFFGLNDALKVVLQLIMRKVMLKGRTKLLKTETEAREWLAKYPIVIDSLE
jgi:hypothetical protein